LTPFFPAEYSLLASTALADLVAKEYALPAPIHCTLLQHGDNDTYLVRSAVERYVLRVWHHDDRPLAEAEGEMRLLAALAAHNAPVATPIQRCDGAYVQAVRAPEGTRFVGLFTYAEGSPPGKEINPDQAHAYGKAVAHLHTAADSLPTTYARPQLDLARLLDAPLHIITPLLAHRPHDVAYLHELAQHLADELKQLPQTPPLYGLCHGDPHKTNVLCARNGQLTLIDFDCCGYGWRAYDLAVFFWSTRHLPQAAPVRTAFLRGYMEHRRVSAQELASIPHFVAAQHICITAVEIEQAARGVWGSEPITDAYFDDRLRFLRTWMQATNDGTYMDL
jgi:Ser/Thr protein kinase RdoA (MazF antagonist)